MATKEEVLQYIKTLGEQKIVTKDELDLAYDSGTGIKTDIVLTKKLGISEILYYIGGAIVFLGIAILLYQNWSTLGFGTKVLATLGAGVAAYFVGVLFSRDERTETAGPAFYLISALVIPMGLYVVFDNAGFDASSYGSQSLISGILFVMYLLSYVVFRKNVFTLFSILFGTWLFFSLTSFMIGGGAFFDSWKFYQYRVLLAGLTYMLIGYAFSKNEQASLSNFLYGFGILGFLGSALSLGGWEPNQNVFWELIYPGLIFGALFLSVHIKSKSFLTWGTLFLMAYILKITSEYFSSGLGWPLALVIAGLSMVGVGYVSLSLKKKYLSA
jgi:hypothetical protein